ncbi:response regulator transcription factor [Pelagicoccus sp. SDUM812005]|uniref:response regulator transcription factor n=1 Tax=Pelagicoccus sp. SDUM812005 TaxID=3041257 RepID=UPI00280EA56F|nr:response regulator transcription factor [Pelagicoccus sp. SDUM812005]MDQ8183296.1 response regulator transcription factor [Pelagicoccus sp. SDUM812005]
MSNTPPTRIVLIEDNQEYRDVIKLALAEVEDLELEEKFGTCEIALRYLQDLSNKRPDIILLDLRLPGMLGLEAIPFIKDYSPKTKIIVLTLSDSESDVLNAISLGASGYLLKSATLDEIVSGIRAVQNGAATLDPSVAHFLLQKLKKHIPQNALGIELSQRELEILTLLGEGLVKKEIADQLGIGYTTVDTHVRHIYEKLQVRNAPSAVGKAYKLGLFNDE